MYVNVLLMVLLFVCLFVFNAVGVRRFLARTNYLKMLAEREKAVVVIQAGLQ